MPECVACRQRKLAFVVLHPPHFPPDAALNSRTGAHFVCTDCAPLIGPNCPFCRDLVIPNPMVISVDRHRCAHLFAVRDEHGNLNENSFTFCGVACGDGTFCHHHSTDFDDLEVIPNAPRQEAQLPMQGQGAAADDMIMTAVLQARAEAEARPQYTNRKIAAMAARRAVIRNRGNTVDQLVERVRGTLEITSWVTEVNDTFDAAGALD